jgi:hypothetical protein
MATGSWLAKNRSEAGGRGPQGEFKVVAEPRLSGGGRLAETAGGLGEAAATWKAPAVRRL